ncbi:potassium channel family protein [Cesiribacter sp. SM1]|uniref:potassium channel family protein n=1 Tax=Cesiribacter sp. SM1 TaxID=2861196 RepID=UPI001CD19F49|nr:potassium channel family protein [Cesiribacter sp. SM1]
MNYLYLVVGFVLITLILRDIVLTALSLQGGGMVTNFISSRFWKLLLKISEVLNNKKLLNHAGYLILLVVLLVWVIALWLGFFLIFLFGADAVVTSSTHAPVQGFKLFYFVGYTLSTLGSGEYIPASDVWRLLANIVSFTGLIFITVSITYFVPILSAVILQEGIGVFINSLGKSPEDIIINGWNGKNFDRLLNRLSNVYQKLIQHTQNYQAYPVVFYFRAGDANRSIVVNLAKLNEALGLLKHVVKQEFSPDDKELLTLEDTLDFYTRIASNYNLLEQHPLPESDLQKLRNSGIPIDTEKAKLFFESDQEFVNRRKVFANILLGSGWSWQEVYCTQERN